MSGSRVDAPAARRARTQPVFPDQHGAWAFLLFPVLLAMAVEGPSTSQIVPVAAWVAAYPLTWALTGRITAPRGAERFSRPVTIWCWTAVPLMVGAVAVQPWLVWVGTAFVVPFGVNLWFASRRRERDLGNDLVLVLECVCAVPIVAALPAGVGDRTPPREAVNGEVGLLSLVCALALIGSTLHVKSLIRERHNPAFATASRWFSIVCVPVASLAAAPVAEPAPIAGAFLVLAGRAWFLHKPSWRPVRVGMVELAGLLIVFAGALVSVR